MCKIIDVFRLLYAVSPNFASIVPALQNLHILAPSSILNFFNNVIILLLYLSRALYKYNYRVTLISCSIIQCPPLFAELLGKYIHYHLPSPKPRIFEVPLHVVPYISNQ